ncbi:MAG: DNA mismatch repair endonuclease MutL [Bacteroidetes bacterium]|nr:MAG: DNA mismatch repair endonuclease MutL [Bacteroidota bacterium]
MSDVIKLLPEHIANQIAAGEVIQRPASVLKELVENALDAGADKIEIWIKDAGKNLIQVIDNGMGMSETDARMAFERHATSKLNDAKDLFALKTKGFRGEALASIAAIAQVSLQTRMEGEELGTCIQIEGSEITDQSQVSCKPGSSFAVKNLFFNVPARRNFLKSNPVELKHLENEFHRITLAHPEISFQFTHNDQLLYHLEKSNLRKRIVDLFGRAYNDRLIPIEEHTDLVGLKGFIGKPEFAKKTRGEQFFFVNNRFFKDTYLNHAVFQAYDNLLASKTYPSYFIFLDVEPSSIDVNVHPNKTEIKFENDREIYAILKSSVKQSLGQFNISPSLDFEQENSFELPWESRKQIPVEPQIKVNPDYNPFQSKSLGGASGSGIKNVQSDALRKSGFGSPQSSPEDWEQFYKLEEEASEQQQQLDLPVEGESSKHFIFQHPFIISPVKSGLLFVHIRRARERVLYDELMQQFLSQPIPSQQLLFPLQAELQGAVKSYWLSNRKTTERLGFVFEESKEGIDFTGIPAPLDQEQGTNCIEQINAQIMHGEPDKGELAHEFILSIASAGSRTHEKWNESKANHLIEQLFQCKEHQYTATGKRILDTIRKEEYLKQF